MKYTSLKTNTDKGKLLKVKGKIINLHKETRGFDPVTHSRVLEFYHRDDVSTAPPGKRDSTKIKIKSHIQKRVLNDYLSNLHQKFVPENTDWKCSFATFVRLTPKNFVFATFLSRKTCLCTQHQNYALKLKMQKKYITIPTRPEMFVKYSDDNISKRS